ncbi:hypothetical protein CFC21_086012 [Triticum aestivum]|uniref:Disease resistance protein At4g27190-like leucine-rich repeats domain-containing protein n=2 Tax=Triticum aestivum TaxID=4565 RepID=A0A3B6PG97_WHEAT|nr:uncharacterized protein LOC123133192 [Triticum aestivum]KAF7082132.1 hypothetical protein CFC21_086012 [Triticum aestivum]
MRIEDIKADTIDVAVERILVELGADTTSSRENAIYFDGWDGLGASAVLQAVAERLAISNEPSTRPTGLEFEKIIHVDCSKWESTRAMQREIAEQLKLPKWVMEIFDKQDEEDDFNGLDQGSRTVIAQVVREIYQATQNRRFLVILHNGSNVAIDVYKFGLYIYGYANSKMLWTFQGRFRLDPKMIDNVKKSTSTDVVLSASRDRRDPQELWSYLLHHEAAQVSCSCNKNGHGIIDPAIVVECALYVLKQCCIGSPIVDYDWPAHTSNYWVCDGIIVLTDIDKAWQVGDVLQHEVRLLDIDNRHNTGESTIMPSSHLSRSTEHMQYWISTSTCGFELSSSGVMPDDMFQHSHLLGVLKLSRCTFSFSSPPFLCCHSLRFLSFLHCQDLRTRTSNAHHYHTDSDKELDSSTTVLWECFQSLWVLDLRYTDWDQILSARMMDLMTWLRELIVMGANNWDMSHLRGRLRNIRKLRVTKSTCCFNNDVFSEMEMLELLDLSGNTITRGMTSLSGAARNHSLQTVIIYGNYGLELISFRGCKELKNLLLKGYFSSLEGLDISGTSVKTLDLGGVDATSLPERIILLGCKKLRAILWPQHKKSQEWSGMLRIDTTSTSAPADGRGVPKAHQSFEQQKEEKFKGWKISLKDARLLRSLYPARYKSLRGCHIDICHADTLVGSKVLEASSDQPYSRTKVDSIYRNILKAGPAAAVTVWDCPMIPLPPQMWRFLQVSCIIKVIMHGQGNTLLEDALLLPDFICDGASSLHVYDNPSITSVLAPPQRSGWNRLIWCRVERCPKLHAVFTIPMVHQGTFSYNVSTGFQSLKTFWASQLLTARYIWDWDWTTATMYIKHSGYFISLVFLHLDYCPRLIHVLVLATPSVTLGALETLEIVHCGDLREVFPLGPELQEQDKIIKFPKLRRIHLCELPKLQSICGHKMYSPNLETIKITGCWSLRRLPTVGDNTKPPKLDCEKEWWNNLEWGGVENHHPSRYESRHSLYYKGQLPRRSVLR